ncbi:MAG: acyl-CoA dehydrogenase family protein [Actinobacteria bacterium]|nr:acyl-CoA dehydrogenase family protein [Actinomycetota bacterium]
MDLSFTPEQESFRAEARAWLASNVPAEPLPSMDTAEGFEAHRGWERTLHAGGWSAVSWPAAYGGRGAGLEEWLIFEEEYWASGSPFRVNQNGLFLFAPTVLEHGTDAQKRRFLPAMAAGDEIWCQGWSEPDAGSDLAGLTSRADRVGDEWVINGQKTWCTRGAFADWLFGLFRTQPGSERHHGLSYLAVPLEAEGVTRRPIAQLNGETGFAEVFFDAVRVPVENTVGAEGDGWKIAMATAGFERGLLLRSPGRFMAPAARLLALAGERAERAPSAAVDDAVAAWMRVEAYRLFTMWTVSRLRTGASIGAESSLNKLWWSEMDIDLNRAALGLLGDEAELASSWTDALQFALAGPIYAGSNEIQRNIVAERVLGLPRG